MIAIKEIMQSPFYKISTSNSVEVACRLMSEARVNYLTIEDEGEIKGVIASRDLLGYPPSRIILDCKISKTFAVDEDMLLSEALKVLERENVGFLVVLNKGRTPIGIASRETIISSICQELEKLNEEKGKSIEEHKKMEKELVKTLRDLGILNKATVDRELRMVELKNIIRELKEKLEKT